MTVSAPRGSGKSYLVKMLLETGLEDYFKHIVVLNPSIDLNDGKFAGELAGFRKNVLTFFQIIRIF
jgi:predicted AAA+ superfamily ATPase